MRLEETEVCKECLNCVYYWENRDDDYMNCDGEDMQCHEFIERSEE